MARLLTFKNMNQFLCTQVKREGWLADKTREIKDVTIKGLEPEIQALVARHRQDLAETQTRAAADAQRQLDALVAQHDNHVRCAVASLRTRCVWAWAPLQAALHCESLQLQPHRSRLMHAGALCACIKAGC